MALLILPSFHIEVLNPLDKANADAVLVLASSITSEMVTYTILEDIYSISILLAEGGEVKMVDGVAEINLDELGSPFSSLDRVGPAPVSPLPVDRTGLSLELIHDDRH